MTDVLKVRNVNDALPLGIALLKHKGTQESSRNGAVLVAPGPVITEYTSPMERVLFSPLRDANPFFHLLESLWMLAGHNDVKFPSHYAANIASFSDDGVTIAGAYGDRWRNRFSADQLVLISEELRKNPTSRRCVLTMWDASGLYGDWPPAETDLFLAFNGGKDVPCNTHVYFNVTNGYLDMTVCCRSNDMIWGAYGANSVHFSFLHEYMARSAELPMGVYRQFSNNFHAYVERPDTVKLFNSASSDFRQAYAVAPSYSYPLISTSRTAFDQDLIEFFGIWHDDGNYAKAKWYDPFIPDVVLPMVESHKLFKEKKYDAAMEELVHCQAWDWRLNAIQWVNRRYQKHLEKRNADE